MRRLLCLAAVALVGGVAAVAAAPATATDSAWYAASVTLNAGAGHTLSMDATVVNVGTITHSATVQVFLTGPAFGFGQVPGFIVTLAPGKSWSYGFAKTQVPPGKYIARIVAKHVFESNDPLGLMGASTSAVTTVTVR